jgi:hypothetical protein
VLPVSVRSPAIRRTAIDVAGQPVRCEEGTPDVPEHAILGRLANKVCVIAGAAGVIGEATAGRLRREGATVVGVDQRAHSVGVLGLTGTGCDIRRAYGSPKRFTMWPKASLRQSSCRRAARQGSAGSRPCNLTSR